MRVRGAVLREVGRPLEIETMTLEPPGPVSCSSGCGPPVCATRICR